MKIFGWGSGERRRNREIKTAQGWRCAWCQAPNGGRHGGDGTIVHLSVVEHEGQHVALCGECRRGLKDVTR